MCLEDECGRLSRRAVVGAGAAIAAGGPALAQKLKPAGVEQSALFYERAGDRIEAYLAHPHGRADAPVVVVLHGNAGLPDDVKDTAVWLATLGYAGLAVNPTSREPDPSTIPRSLLKGREFGDRYIADTRAGVARLRPEGRARRVGVVGYCGGGYTALLWGAEPFGAEVGAFVGIHTPLRGREPDGALSTSRPHGIDLYRSMTGPAQFHFGGADGYTPKVDIDELAAKDAGRSPPTEIYVYAGAEHGFGLYTDQSYTPQYAPQLHERAARFLKRRWPARG